MIFVLSKVELFLQTLTFCKNSAIFTLLFECVKLEYWNWLDAGWDSNTSQNLRNSKHLPCWRFPEVFFNSLFPGNGVDVFEYFFSTNTNSAVKSPWMLSWLLLSELKYGLPWRGITCLEVDAICNSSTETIPSPRNVLLSSSSSSVTSPPSHTSNNISDVFDVRLLQIVKNQCFC